MTTRLRGAPTLIVALGALVLWILNRESRVAAPYHLGLYVPTDLTVYLLGGQRVNDGGDLYGAPLLGDLPFTYPPFSGAVFRWLATLTPDLATILWQGANLAALVGVILLVLHERRKRIDAPAIAVIVLLTGAMLVFEPVRGSFYYGQINLLLLLLIACDVLPRRGRWPGVGVGLAAGLKLTPAFAGLIFLLQRRWWAALISVATFLVTVIIGFLFVPDAMAFWRDAMFNSDRVGVHANPGAQSWRSVLERVLGVESTAVWLVAVVLTVAAVALGVWVALRRDNRSMALVIAGIGSSLVSPFSWFHHWVWVVPLAVCIIIGITDLLGRTFWLAQLGALLSLGAVALVSLPWASAILWPKLSFHGAAADPTAPWNLAFTLFGLLVILGYTALGFAREAFSRGSQRPPRRNGADPVRTTAPHRPER